MKKEPAAQEASAASVSNDVSAVACASGVVKPQTATANQTEADSPNGNSACASDVLTDQK